jgi:organic hydroperoxide reductase OsmC/OhrA
VDLARNEDHRLRIPRVRVTLRPTVTDSETLDACLSNFQDYCVVTQSVRQGVDIEVSVDPFVDGAIGPTA